MFLINLNVEIVACKLSFRKSRHKPNLENTSKYGFSPDLGGKNGGVLSMRMQVILDSSFARPGSAPIWGGKKGEFRDWTSRYYKYVEVVYLFVLHRLATKRTEIYNAWRTIVRLIKPFVFRGFRCACLISEK